jgi:hypothetical protein
MLYTLVPVFFQNDGEVFCVYLIPQMYSGITTHVLLPLTVKFDFDLFLDFQKELFLHMGVSIEVTIPM